MADRDTSPLSTSSTLSNITIQTEKHVGLRISSSASPPTSTPPTSLGDEASILSDATKMDLAIDTPDGASTPKVAVETDAPPHPDSEGPNSESRRPARSSRKSVTTYNVQILAGTAIHTPTKYLEKHHKNVLHGPLEDVIQTGPATPPKKRASRLRSEPLDSTDPAEEQLASEVAQAAQRRTSSRVSDMRKEALRNLTGIGEAVASKLSSGKGLAQNALRRSASDSRLKSTVSSMSRVPAKRPRTAQAVDVEDDSEEKEEEKVYLKPKTKAWMKQGLYVGQHRDFNPRLTEGQNRAKKQARGAKEKTVLPLPIYAGDRLLSGDPREFYRDFKLPFDTYNPLPRKVKVDGWVKLHRNRFIGESAALWKHDKQDSSQCYCEPEDGCGETCHNRIMAYECDSTNCPLTPELCQNRPFAQLKKRAKGNRYDYGVEVTQTGDKGYGVRAMRTFEPHQIIVEYAGEIITQSECERRMKQVYKKDKCYYLMSFDNKMIIDATRGTIARFVNHSCEPNCEMIKWTVGGEPRMALFAGRRGIMTGEELTYDYNFDPFSQKNIQECRCGTESCRGVLGPKPKKPAPEEKSMASAFIAGTKRKLQSLLGGRGGSASAPNSPKKRKISMGPAGIKAKNALAASTAARVRAEKEAEEHSRQIASRENRAMIRSGDRRARTVKLRTTNLPTVKSTRVTTVTFKHKVAKPGALKPVTKGRGPKILRVYRGPSANNKPPVNTKRPATPIENAASDEESTDDDTPNITPSSLRSANKKLKQSTLPFKPLGKFSDERHTEIGKKLASTKGKKRGDAPAPRGIRKTGAGVKKATHPAGRRIGAGKGRLSAKA